MVAISATWDSRWRTNSRSTLSRSSRIGSNICARTADESVCAVGFTPDNDIPTKLWLEQPLEVGLGGFTNFVSAHAPQLPDGFRDADHMRGLVPFPAIGHGRTKRTVCLDQQAIERHHLRDFLQLERARKRDDAGQRDVEPDVERPRRHRAIAGETVKDAANIARVLLPHNAKRVIVGFAHVNDDRPPPKLRQANLRP